jgi:hypothetical protein
VAILALAPATVQSRADRLFLFITISDLAVDLMPPVTNPATIVDVVAIRAPVRAFDRARENRASDLRIHP